MQSADAQIKTVLVWNSVIVTKCEGNYEYCMDHLYTHKHVKKEDADNSNSND